MALWAAHPTDQIWKLCVGCPESQWPVVILGTSTAPDAEIRSLCLSLELPTAPGVTQGAPRLHCGGNTLQSKS